MRRELKILTVAVTLATTGWAAIASAQSDDSKNKAATLINLNGHLCAKVLGSVPSAPPIPPTKRRSSSSRSRCDGFRVRSYYRPCAEKRGRGAYQSFCWGVAVILTRPPSPGPA